MYDDVQNLFIFLSILFKIKKHTQTDPACEIHAIDRLEGITRVQTITPPR